MQRFDTYNTISRYAKDPDSPETFLAFHALKQSTDAMLLYDALKDGNIELADRVKLLSVGAIADIDITRKAISPLTAQDIADMDKDKRDAFYFDLCRQAGFQIDPETLMNQPSADNTK